MSNSIRVNLEEYLHRYLASNCVDVVRTINVCIKAFDGNWPIVEYCLKY